MSAFEDELRPVREALLHDAEEGGKLLSELPEVEIAPGVLEPISQTSLIPDSESSELMAEPAWALSRDLKAAYLDLKRIGVINDASDLCLLLSIGENHLLPDERRRFQRCVVPRLLDGNGRVVLFGAAATRRTGF